MWPSKPAEKAHVHRPDTYRPRMSGQDKSFFQTLDSDYSKDMLNKLMSTANVKKAVERKADELQKQTKLSRENCERKAWYEAYQIVDKMMAKMDNQRLFGVTAVMIEGILTKMYNQGIHIKKEESVMLTDLAAQCAKTRTSMILLPCHKSHIDYLVVSYLCYCLGISLPHIAAGDNLNMPVVGSILRNGGAFFIRRQWGNDHMYTSIMREYLELLLREGHNLEAFIEGGRSRMGKLLQPKFGILKTIVDAVHSGSVRDAVIVPISIGYDKVIETSSYIDELLGGRKEKESLSQLLSSVNLLSKKLGLINISLGKPFWLKDFLSQHNDIGSKKEDYAHCLNTLGFKILSEINSASVVMPTALVGTALLTLRGRGVGKEELVRKVNWMKRRIVEKGGKVLDFGSLSTYTIVERATAVLHDLIGSHQDLMEPVYYPLKRFELSYYRNQVIHIFISESIVSAALYATIKQGGSVEDQAVLIRPTLLEDTFFLSSLLKYEFIFEGGGIEENLEKALEKMSLDNILSIEEEQGEPGQGAFVDGRKKWVRLSEEERRIGRENFDFYCFLIWPFIETYWLASMCLFSLIPENHPGFRPDQTSWSLPPTAWVSEKQFYERCQFFAKTLYYEGDLSYFESINKETIKNAFSRFMEKGVLLRSDLDKPPTLISPNTVYSRKDKSSTESYIAIHPLWYPTQPMPQTFATHGQNKMNKAPGLENESRDSTSVWYFYKPTGKLWDLCEMISRFRREGKNRRDTATVSSRVLRLCRQSRFWTFDANRRKLPQFNGPKL